MPQPLAGDRVVARYQQQRELALGHCVAGSELAEAETAEAGAQPGSRRATSLGVVAGQWRGQVTLPVARRHRREQVAVPVARPDITRIDTVTKHHPEASPRVTQVRPRRLGLDVQEA